MLLRPRLLRPDHASWQRDASYSQQAARALRAAFTRISAADAVADHLFWACGLVAPWLHADVSPRQRARVLLLFARTHEAEANYAEAREAVDRALVESIRGHAHEDFMDLLVYHAKLARALGHYDLAANDLYACLELHDLRVFEHEEPPDRSLQIELLSQLADYEFFLGHFERAEHLASDALRLAPLLPDKRLEAAAAARTHAQIDRVRGLSWQALPVMQRVVQTYAQVPAPAISRGRNEYLLADFALDVAERIPDGPAAANRTEPLRLAQRHLESAEFLARQTGDEPGRGLIALGRARHSRLHGTNDDRVARIEWALAMGQRRGDHALLAQGFTALGDEYIEQGEWERGLDCYRQVLGLLDGSAFPALGIWPRRKLLRAREMSSDDDAR